MTLRIKKVDITLGPWNSHAFLFIPSKEVELKKAAAVFTHGYTSHKGSILTWPTRLAEEGIASILFDLPGHYLGSFNEVNSFEEFKKDSHKLFQSAYNQLSNEVDTKDKKIILGGHSLGGLLACKALALSEFDGVDKMAIAVGLGLAPEKGTHLFETDFYKSTLIIREQLVSAELNHENVFNWLKSEKESLSVSDNRVHLITGMDDLVVGKSGSERLKELLESKNNTVTLDRPTKLPHHMPEMGASFVKKFLKSEGII